MVLALVTERKKRRNFKEIGVGSWGVRGGGRS